MLEKLKQYLIQNDYSYEDVNKRYLKRLNEKDNVSLTICNEVIISLFGYKGNSIRNLLMPVITEQDLVYLVNTVKEFERWIIK